MPIPTFLLDRIRASALSGTQVADTFTKLAHVADHGGAGDCAVNIEYVGEGDRLVPGDLIPTITLSLVRQTDSAESA
jgi:hypothetical protein